MKTFIPTEQILTKCYGYNRKKVKNTQEDTFYRKFKQVTEKCYQVCE
jgi:hypothetical protein